jgi:hypothetical protein
MALDTHRKALRGGLPWIVVALCLLAASAALAAGLQPFLASEWVATTGTALGALGSGAMLLGLLQLARARSGGRSSAALLAAFPLWLVEFATRLGSLALSDSPGSTSLAVRLLAASLAMLCLSRGMLWLFARQNARAQIPPWRLSQALFGGFALLLAAALGLARLRAPDGGLWPWIESLPAGTVLAWLAFVAPWLALVHAVRRSVRHVARRQTVAEVLTG